MTRKISALFFIIFIMAIPITNVYAMAKASLHEPAILRVMVVKAVKNVTLEVKGSYKMVSLRKGNVLKEGRFLQGIISAEDIDLEGIKILPDDTKGRILVNNRRFRGIIDIIKNQDKTVSVINHIDVEEYLYGVLYHEVSHRWPMEVLKAQAIAARTYALYKKLTANNRYFDLTSDIYSQVYGGRTSETWRTTRAVNLTKGRILAYKGSIFPAYFHATCGGRTSRAGSIWDIDLPPLQGRLCGFCEGSPHYGWKKELGKDYIETKLREAGHDIKINSIDILKRDDAGRILNMAVKGEKGSLELSGNKFRLLMGPNIIRSANFEVLIKGSHIEFHGKGWGHGIGLCQWGAFYMAKKGWSAEDILKYYYPGAEIARLEQ